MSEKREYRTVTKETVVAVKEKLNDPRYFSLTLEDIGRLCNTSGASVSRIKNGRYDHLLAEVNFKNLTLDDIQKENVETTESNIEGVLKELNNTQKALLTELKKVNDNLTELLRVETAIATKIRRY